VGNGDFHESTFAKLGKSTWLAGDDHQFSRFDQDFCQYKLLVYPSKAMLQDFLSNRPLWYTAVVALLFFAICVLFYVYDVLVERRQKTVMEHAVQSNAIVSSLFPEQVRDRLFGGETDDEQNHESFVSDDLGRLSYGASSLEPTLPIIGKHRLKSFLSDETQEGQNGSTKPIADLFPHCTVLVSKTTQALRVVEFSLFMISLSFLLFSVR
jgi:hypothetical protein